MHERGLIVHEYNLERRIMMEKRKFKIVEVEVHSYSTDYTISDLGHSNVKNTMSPESFIHCIGAMFGKHLGDLKGLEFEVLVPGGALEDKSLELCGKTLYQK